MNLRKKLRILGSLGIILLGSAGLLWRYTSSSSPPEPLPYETIARLGWFQMCWEERSCVIIGGVPCSCREAGADYAINGRLEKQWKEYQWAKLKKETGYSAGRCLAHHSNVPRCKSDVVPVCLRNRCVLRSRSTGEIWAD